jgi:hypothetical protein
MAVRITKPEINVREKLSELEGKADKIITGPPSFRVDLHAVQTIASTAHTVYAAGTIHWDTHNAYDTDTYTYTVPISGIYLFNVTNWWSSKPEGRSLSRVLINNVAAAYHYELSDAGGSWTHQSMHNLTKGDTVQMTIYQDSGSSQTLDPDNLNNGWTGVMVSGTPDFYNGSER